MSRKTLEISHVVIESKKSAAEVRASLERRLEAAPEISILLVRDHGTAVQYEIPNSLTASSMTRCARAAALYLPLRFILCERADGGSLIEYDLPSSLFGQFGDERVTELARALDVALGAVLSAAAG